MKTRPLTTIADVTNGPSSPALTPTATRLLSCTPGNDLPTKKGRRVAQQRGAVVVRISGARATY
jgi:hypothetical protein